MDSLDFPGSAGEKARAVDLFKGSTDICGDSDAEPGFIDAVKHKVPDDDGGRKAASQPNTTQ